MARPLVLHVLEALEGGTARHVVDLVRHADGTAHEVVLPRTRVGGVTDRAAPAALVEAGAVVHHLPMRRTPWAPANAVALARLTALVRRVGPDIVHGHSSIGGLLARLAAGGGRPRVYTPNGITDVRVGQSVERALARLSDRVVAVSDSEARAALDLGLTSPAHLVTIPNGIDVTPPPPLDLRARLGLDGSTPLVGTIARLVPQKAPLDFVDTCARIHQAVPAARFVLVGDGALHDEFVRAVHLAGLDDVLHHLPVLEDAARALGDLDVFVLTSRFEGGPYAPLEAMRAGTPVVLTDVVGNRDVVDHGVTGLLVPAGDTAAAATAAVELLRAPGDAARLAAAAGRRLAEHFDVRRMGARYDALYLELAGARGPSDVAPS